MGVAEIAFTVTSTVSPVLKAVVLAVIQIVSAVWALTLNTEINVKIIARVNTLNDFIKGSKDGAHHF